MIRILITDDEIRVRGHAFYAPRGKDIVCAAVSAIIHTAILGLIAVSREYGVHVEVNDQRVNADRKDTRDEATNGG